MPEVAYVTMNTKPAVTTTELSGRTSAYLVAEVRPQISPFNQDGRLFQNLNTPRDVDEAQKKS